MALLCVWALPWSSPSGLFSAGGSRPRGRDHLPDQRGAGLCALLGPGVLLRAADHHPGHVLPGLRGGQEGEPGLQVGPQDRQVRLEQVTLRIHRKNAPVGGSGVTSAKNKTHFSRETCSNFAREESAKRWAVVGCFVLWLAAFFLSDAHW